MGEKKKKKEKKEKKKGGLLEGAMTSKEAKAAKKARKEKKDSEKKLKKVEGVGYGHSLEDETEFDKDSLAKAKKKMKEMMKRDAELQAERADDRKRKYNSMSGENLNEKMT